MRRRLTGRGPRFLGACAAVACSLLFANEVSADDVHVASDTSFQLYEVRSPGTSAFMARRRLVQTLSASYSHELVEARAGNAERVTGPLVTTSLRLRLDQDFGSTCLVDRDLCVRATDPSDAGAYQPLASDTDVDAPEAWVEIRNLPLAARVRAGRHLFWGPAGILRIDGATASAAPLGWFDVSVFGGALVRRTSLAATGTFEPQGVVRQDLPDRVDPARYPWVAPETTTWTYGGALGVGHERYAHARLGFRQLSEEDGTVAQNAELSLATHPIDEARLHGQAVIDLVDGTIFDAVADLSIDPIDELTVRARAEHHVPRFDWGSIWMYFDLVPVSEALVSASVRPSDSVEIGAGLRGRRSDFGEGLVEEDGAVEGQVRATVEGVRVFAQASSWAGSLGPVASVLLDVSRRIVWWALLDARVSIWHFDDPLRSGLYGTSVAEALGAELRLSEQASLRIDVEHSYNRVAGHRLRAVAHLSLEVWR